MQDAIVIIPTYNEIENIEVILTAVFSQYNEVHVLVVDDNSPDQTAQNVETLQATFGQRHYEFIFEMDADFSHNPKDLQSLYEACKTQQADVAVGSRYIKGVNVVNWPLSRVLLSYGASLYVRLITGMKVLDPTAGFVCYKRNVLEAIDLNAIRFIGYAFQIEMKYIAYKKNFNIKEIPIIFTDRLHGVSKLNKGIIKEAILGVIKIRLKTILGTS